MSAFDLHQVIVGEITLIGLLLALSTTLALLLAYGLGFLLQPSRTSLLWASAFTVAAIGACGVVASDAVRSADLRLGALGLFAGLPALMWSALRAQRGAIAFAWVGPLLCVAGSAAMVIGGDTAVIGPVWRQLVLVPSAFSALIVVEWLRQPRPRDRFALPLVVISGLFALVGLASSAAALWELSWRSPEPDALRIFRSSMLSLYLAAGLLATIGPPLKALRKRPAARSSEWDLFEEQAHEALVSGRETRVAWSLVYVQIDDVAEVRKVVGAAQVASVTSHVEEVMRSAFPAGTLLASAAPGVVVALVPGPDGVMRDHIRAVLAAISQLPAYGRLPVRPSASAGWAPCSSVGYDLMVLLYLAAQAAANAESLGGDRWQRVTPATVLGRVEPTGAIARLLSG